MIDALVWDLPLGADAFCATQWDRRGLSFSAQSAIYPLYGGRRLDGRSRSRSPPRTAPNRSAAGVARRVLGEPVGDGGHVCLEVAGRRDVENAGTGVAAVLEVVGDAPGHQHE